MLTKIRLRSRLRSPSSLPVHPTCSFWLCCTEAWNCCWSRVCTKQFCGSDLHLTRICQYDDDQFFFFTCNLKLYHCHSYFCRSQVWLFLSLCACTCLCTTFLAWVNFRKCASLMSCVTFVVFSFKNLAPEALCKTATLKSVLWACF